VPYFHFPYVVELENVPAGNFSHSMQIRDSNPTHQLMNIQSRLSGNATWCSWNKGFEHWKWIHYKVVCKSICAKKDPTQNISKVRTLLEVTYT